MKKLNAPGEKMMKKHMADVKGARSSLKKEAGTLKVDIGKKITHALSQDKKVLGDMKKADKKKGC